MGPALLDSAKKALTNSPLSSKAVPKHPLQNDNKSWGDLENRRYESPKAEDITAVGKDAPSQHGSIGPPEKDVRRSPDLQSTRESMRKEATTSTPERIQGRSPNGHHKWKHYLRDLTEEMEGLQGRLLAMQDTLNTAQNTSEARMKEIKRLQEEIKRISAEKKTGNKICELERKIHAQDEDIQNLRQKLRISEEQRSQTTKMLEDRTAELKGAQAFLTTADRYSGADIIKMAESLNTEIFQASAMMAEVLVETPIMEDCVQKRQDNQSYKNCLDRGPKLMGSRLFDHLIAKSTEIRVDPLPLQLALQALLTCWCVHEVNCFCGGPAEKSLKEIYKRIYKSQIQAVAGRWRAMTILQTMNSDTQSQAAFVSDIIMGLIYLCGWSESEASQRAAISVQEAVLRVERVWKTLKVAIMQEITAADITLIHVGAGCDYKVDKMDDMYMDTSGATTNNGGQQQILCMVGVGLQRDVSKRSENGTMKCHREVVLKPKVALYSVLLNGGCPDTKADKVLSATDGKD